MTIKLGKTELKVSTPSDLDDKLVELCGCSAKEMKAMIEGVIPAPVTLATALLPFVSDNDISRQELGQKILDDGDYRRIRDEVVALYDKAEGGTSSGKGK